MEERKRGRPLKFSREHMLKMKAVYSGTRAGNRQIQNHYYQTCSFPEIMEYHKKNPIDNFEFLYKDETHFKETIFTELGRTSDFICQYYSKPPCPALAPLRMKQGAADSFCIFSRILEL